MNADPVRESRVTTNDAYLEPARDRRNLTVRGDTLVDRVLVEGGTAVGVRALVDGSWTDVPAARSCCAPAPCTPPRSCCARGSGPGGASPTCPSAAICKTIRCARSALPLRERSFPAHASDRHTNVCVRYSSQLAGAGRNDMMLVGMNSAPMGPVGVLGVWVNECRSRGLVDAGVAGPDRSIR